MKIVFLSNYYNHHQASFCNAMHERLCDSFRFIQTMEMESERKNMGWGEENEPVFLRKIYRSAEERAECLSLIADADVVITGSAPESFLRDRIKRGKAVVRYSERLLKDKNPLRFVYWYLRAVLQNPKGANVYLLCSSAFTAPDYAKFGLFGGRCYKWGYFPEVKRYDNIDGLIGKKKKASILWVARFIKLKHPELPLAVAKRLRDEGYSFELNLIGSGVLEGEIRSTIKKYDLADHVNLLGTMKPWQVREHMEEAQIFLFTSDRHEGWGAVLNESMNSGCSVVASDAIGSAPYLISDGENGFTFADGDADDLYLKVKRLIDDDELCSRIGRAAYETMATEWNAEEATERLLCLLDDLMKDQKCDRFPKGPCSRAD